MRKQRERWQSYENPDIFDRWANDVTRGLIFWPEENTRKLWDLDEGEYRVVLRAMLAEMKSLDILRVDRAKMNTPDLTSWKQTLMTAATAAISTLKEPIQQILRNNPSGSIESLMFEVGLRLNETAHAQPTYNVNEYYSRIMRKSGYGGWTLVSSSR